MNNVYIKGSPIRVGLANAKLSIPKIRLKKSSHFRMINSKRTKHQKIRLKIRNELDSMHRVNLPAGSRSRLAVRNSITPMNYTKEYCTKTPDRREPTPPPKIFKNKKQNTRYHCMLQGFFKKIHENDQSRNSLKKEVRTVAY
ncbi:unnamed protein product [Moneuplotes crassus]|uniref:Uncharacterized protein n=1 Tax=Euplotes crassus TaxID=5936 RepID=A0AAD1XUK2_EUPCR|nr:unnamed protein product [Moneuplotes crassus]